MNHSFGLLRNCILAGALALAATIAPALAATQAYLDFESTGSQSELPIKGEVQDSDLKGTLVKVSAFSFGAGKDGFIPKSTIGSATGGAGAGKITATPESMDVTVGMDATKSCLTWPPPARLSRTSGYWSSKRPRTVAKSRRFPRSCRM